MALNERSGLFTVEVLAGIAGIAYLLYVTEKARSYITDTHPVDYTFGVYYSHEIDKNPPTYQSSQSDIDDYNIAAQWVLAHPSYFDSSQITKANDWIRKVTADPNYLKQGYDVDLIQRIKSNLRAPWPAVPSQNLEVMKRYAEASYVTDHKEWFTPDDIQLATQFKIYVESAGSQGGTSQSQSGPPVPDDYVPPPPPTPESQTTAVQEASQAARKPPQSYVEAMVQAAQSAAARAQQQATTTAQQQANIDDANSQQAARQDSGASDRYNY